MMRSGSLLKVNRSYVPVRGQRPRRGAPVPRSVYVRRRLIAVTVVVVVVVVVLAALVVGVMSDARGLVRHARPGALAPRASGPVVLLAGHSRVRAKRSLSELRVVEHVLAYTSYIAAGQGRRREVALTFDDGPGPFTPRILAVLKRRHVKATFFEIGRQVSLYPRFTAQLARAGMVIGDHTETHPPMAQLSVAAQAAELDQASEAIHAAGAPRPLLFRPPYGSFDSTTLALLRARSRLMALWSVDTRDYARPGVPRITYVALSGAKPGAIILFHDGGGDRAQTLAALPRIIEKLKARGYRLVTIPQLLKDDPPSPHQSPPHNLSGF